MLVGLIAIDNVKIEIVDASKWYDKNLFEFYELLDFFKRYYDCLRLMTIFIYDKSLEKINK